MLTYRRSDSLHLEGYSDSDFAGDVDDRKSTLGYVFTLAGGAISWKSSKQTITTSSMMYAEFVACYEDTRQVNWLKKFIPRCGRTARNNTHSETLVFHQTLSTPKASYIRQISLSTPQGRTRIIHVFPLGSNNKNEFTVLIPFHTTRVLRTTLLQY